MWRLRKDKCRQCGVVAYIVISSIGEGIGRLWLERPSGFSVEIPTARRKLRRCWAGHSSVEEGCAGGCAGCSGEEGRRRGKRSRPLGEPLPSGFEEAGAGCRAAGATSPLAPPCPLPPLWRDLYLCTSPCSRNGPPSRLNLCRSCLAVRIYGCRIQLL